MKMRTLVTGASGFIGSRLLGPNDHAMVRRPSSLANEILADLGDKESLLKACEGVDLIFHCAGYAHAFKSSDLTTNWRINYEGTNNLVDAAGRKGVKQFVFLSSVKAMNDPGVLCIDEEWPGKPSTPYGRAKRAAEEAVLEAGSKYGMHVVNLRLAMVYGRGGRGNLERMARGIRSGWFPPIPETNNKRSLIHVDDVVTAMRFVANRLEANGRTYIVADQQAYSGRQIYDAIREVLRLPRISWSVPFKALYVGGAVGNLLESRLNRKMPLNSEVVDRLVGSAWYSSTRIWNDLGWQAKISLVEGLKEMLNDEETV